jgi:hypothetical protein
LNRARRRATLATAGDQARDLGTRITAGAPADIHEAPATKGTAIVALDYDQFRDFSLDGLETTRVAAKGILPTETPPEDPRDPAFLSRYQQLLHNAQQYWISTSYDVLELQRQIRVDEADLAHIVANLSAGVYSDKQYSNAEARKNAVDRLKFENRAYLNKQAAIDTLKHKLRESEIHVENAALLRKERRQELAYATSFLQLLAGEAIQ